MQSDVWGYYNASSNTIEHISGGDWSVNAGTINGWLRNFLWSQAAQVIQSYGSSLSQYEVNEAITLHVVVFNSGQQVQGTVYQIMFNSQQAYCYGLNLQLYLHITVTHYLAIHI
jgi:hypothetical protein